MKLLDAHIVGHAGIYNKSKISDIYIDFTKCKHKIVLIVGLNGSGKSTLLSVLQPLPDDLTLYLDWMECYKELKYFDNGDIYKIKIVYPRSISGKRGQTKAFLTEIGQDGINIELNPNGNIGSFKDALYSRFNLDPNFVSLSQLSIEDRGIVDKKPSERKKYVTALLECTEVYNNIYKTLVKRSSTFKSMINSITAKIDSVGDEEKLSMELQSLVQRLAFLNDQKNLYSSKLAKAQATIELLDPNGSIQNLYSSLVKEYNELSEQINTIHGILDRNKYKSESDALSAYTKIDEERSSIISQIQYNENMLRSTIAKREDEAQAIQLKQKRIDSLSLNVDMNELKNKIIETRKKIFKYESSFKSIGLKNFKISKDEYVSGLNTLNDLRNMILTMKSYSSDEAIQLAVEEIRTNTSSTIEPFESIKKSNEEILQKSREDISYYTGLLSKLDILNGRPSKCDIDNCIFIKDALEAKNQEPQKAIDELQKIIEVATQSIIDADKNIQFGLEVLKAKNDINIIKRSINTNKALLNKLPNGSIFSDIESLLDRISNGDNFNDIYELYKYLDYGNLLELYKSECDTLATLESTYAMNKEKYFIIDSLYSELTELMNKISNIETTIESIKSENLNLNKKLVDIEDEKKYCSIIVDKYKLLSSLKLNLSGVKSRISTVEGDVAKISQSINDINMINSNIENITNEIVPKQDQLDQIKYSITKLKEYRAELEQYNSKFALVETIKKYSSPTKGGIQTLFMKLYMNKTLQMSNKLLSLFFGGQLELLEYKITENEFSIPCKNIMTSMVNDDISSCSTAERSMISMIISFALLHQSSTKYNILRVDEADATLDRNNKPIFPVVMNGFIDLMNIEMCIMITHSTEIDMSDVDIISLYRPDGETLNGNVIFSLY